MKSNSVQSELAFSALFLYLKRRGLPLSVRDLQDGLRALHAGYGVCRREDLHWLCETLWARTEEEARWLDLLFSEFPLPNRGEVAALMGRPEPAQPLRNAETGTEVREPAEAAPAPQFVPVAESGLGLPAANVRVSRSEAFILSPRPAVTLRSLIVTWRRYRRPQRSGPHLELDMDATIAEQARRRLLIEPVMIPARCNQARISMLVDVSPSMTPWQNLHTILAESLHESRLAHEAVYYFYNVPEDGLYETDSLIQPVSPERPMHGQTANPLIIVSDAGAARGSRNPDRVQATQEFLARVSGFWHPTAWANPMPRRRWRGTSAEQISRLQGVSMVELTEDGLTQAVDILRGQRNG